MPPHHVLGQQESMSTIGNSRQQLPQLHLIGTLASPVLAVTQCCLIGAAVGMQCACLQPSTNYIVTQTDLIGDLHFVQNLHDC